MAGALPQTHWGSLLCSPDPIAGFGGHFAAGEGLGWGRGGEGEGGGSVGEGKGGPQVTVELWPLRALLRHCLTLKITIMYAVKDDTKTKFNIVLYISYFPSDGGGFIRGL